MRKLFLLLMLSSCNFVMKDGKYVDDNPVEEITEAVIQHETGVNVDLTPWSPEK